MPRLKGLPETVPIKEVYAAFRAGFHAGCDFTANSRSNCDYTFLAIRRAAFLKKRFHYEVPTGEFCKTKKFAGMKPMI